MVMAQRLSQTALKMSNGGNCGQGPSSRLLNARFRSGGSSRKDSEGGGQLIEVDLGDSATENGENSSEVFGIKRLEDAIHGILVRRAAPDWLPFLPGTSYWVPPRKNNGTLVELLGRLSSNPMTQEESLSFTTSRGWPSSAYFIEGGSQHQVEVVPVQNKKSEEEEG